MNDLKKTLISSFWWVALSQFGRVGIQFAGILILARILAPADFGIIALAAIVTGFVSLFRDFGTLASVIQKSVLSPQFLNSVFWLNIGLGIFLSCMLGLFAPLIADGFSEPKLKGVLWLLLFSLPLNGFGAVFQTLLERSSNFRTIAAVESGAAFLSLMAAIYLALAGWGVFSLVTQILLTSFLNAMGFWWFAKWRPGFLFDIAELRTVCSYGFNFTGFNLLNYFIRNADNILIGKILGPTDLGYYSMAYRLMLWPIQNISNIVGRVLFPVFSKMQVNKKWIADTYTKSTEAILIITAPLMVGLFIIRESFVSVVLGDQWLDVAPILAFLIPVGLMQSINSSVGSIYLATGQTKKMLVWGIFAASLIIPCFFIGVTWGIVGVAAGYAAASALLFLPCLAVPLKLIDLPLNSFITNLLPPLGASAFMGICMGLVQLLLPIDWGTQIIRLIFISIVGIAVYIATSLYIQRPLLKYMAKTIFG